MGKEKIATLEVEGNNGSANSNDSNCSNIIMQYAPILIGLICLVFCYLLYKKIQTLNSVGDSVSNLEKHFTHYIKEQTELNTFNNKKFNTLATQINQLNYILQNQNERKTNNINTQMSPERKNSENTNLEVKETRELLPSITVPPSNQLNELPKPISTTNKKSAQIENNISILKNKSDNKKVINLETLQEQVLIEEASSDED